MRIDKLIQQVGKLFRRIDKREKSFGELVVGQGEIARFFEMLGSRQTTAGIFLELQSEYSSAASCLFCAREILSRQKDA